MESRIRILELTLDNLEKNFEELSLESHKNSIKVEELELQVKELSEKCRDLERENQSLTNWIKWLEKSI